MRVFSLYLLYLFITNDNGMKTSPQESLLDEANTGYISALPYRLPRRSKKAHKKRQSVPWLGSLSLGS
jgi:hypothetical protein